jgi:hypothetical protein
MRASPDDDLTDLHGLLTIALDHGDLESAVGMFSTS